MITINNDIKYFNNYLMSQLSPIPLYFSEPRDYKKITKYVHISWKTGNFDQSHSYNEELKRGKIEAYTREDNINSHYDFGEVIINLLPHILELDNDSVIRISNIEDRYYELADFELNPIRKAEITFEIKKFKENI